MLAGLAILSGQPGVVCITPVAWLLALWCGARYSTLSGGRGERHPLLGPALAGAVLGAAEGIFFALVIGQIQASDTPADLSKGAGLIAIIFTAGVIICAGLSVFTAALTLKRRSRTRV